jgi:hypothetical protein
LLRINYSGFIFETPMPLPLIPILAALAAGGSLVPHAAGGLIVTSAAGYVTGTYLSTAAITALWIGGVGVLGTGVAVVTGAAASVIGGAGIFGTTIGATGITGALMSAGIVSATPIWAPIAMGSAAVGMGYGAFKYYRLRKKLTSTPEGQEAQFTEGEAKVIEKYLRLAAKRQKPTGSA